MRAGLLARALGTLAVAGFASGSSAHHSSAMFDATKIVELTGTVRLFQWSNPHCYIQLVVRDANGQEQEWSLEMGAPMYLYNRGWRPSSVKPGDRLTVKLASLRNGEKGGLLMDARNEDGKPLGRQPSPAP